MARKHKELNFITLISIVIGSQIGSGAFVLPSAVAPFKTIGLLGWIISISGAICLALLFSDLSSNIPKNGGPHVYVSAAFGRVAGFFTAWIYWIISWTSNSLLLVATTSYLSIITGTLESFQLFMLQVGLLFLITYINIVGMKFSGIVETILTALKILPLLFLPVIFFLFFDPEYFKLSIRESSVDGIGVTSTIASSALLTFWGFIGVECGTTPAGQVKNYKKNIPRAIIIGTSCVALIYILNTVSVIGVVGFDALGATQAPYAVVLSKIFTNYSNIVISIIAIIVCVGTLNAWTLTSSQIALGAYHDGLFPKIFGKVNKSGAPKAALIISALGLIPFLIIEQLNFWNYGLDKLIGMLVSIFVFVYLICSIAYLKLLRRWKKSRKEILRARILAQFCIIFCIFVLSQDILSSIVVLIIFILIGVPVFLKYKDSIKALVEK